MSALWSPLSAREGSGAFDLREEVPASLEATLREWIYGAVCKLGDSGRRLMIKLDLALPQEYVDKYNHAYARYQHELQQHREAVAQKASTEESSQPSGTAIVSVNQSMLASFAPAPRPPSPPRTRFLAYGTPRSQLLDIIDGLLHLLPYRPPPLSSTDPIRDMVRRARFFMRTKEREQLDQLLSDGRMIYRVRADGRGLERRVGAVSTAAALTAADVADQAGYPAAARRLTLAWNKIYALKPDPGGAYHDAVRAVEAVACPLFLPKDSEPTLGKVITHLDQATGKYQLVIADRSNQPASIDAVREMMRVLWFGHRDRHEGGPTSAPITPESAQAAVSIAVSLVHLLAAGCIGPRT
ncbi:MAG: hypothetical protein ACLPKE_26745 [Streptosporangiaceae bacterium]